MNPLYGTSGLDLGLDFGGLTPEEMARARARVAADALRGAPPSSYPGSSTSLTAAPGAPAAFAPAPQAKGQDFAGRRAALERQQQALEQPADYSQLGSYAKQRAGESRRQLVLALAAQRAGKDFAPVAQHFLRASESQQGPVSVTGGLVNEGGEFVADPQFQRQRQREQITQQMGRLDTQEQAAAQFATEQARRAEEAAGRREDRQATREATAAQREDTRGLRVEQQKATNLMQLSRQWEGISQNYRTQQEAVNNARAIGGKMKTGQKLSPVELQSLGIILAKVQDPNSVVMPSEAARVAAVLPLLDKYGPGAIVRMVNGEPFTQEMARDVANVIETYSDAATRSMQLHADQYKKRAQSMGLDPTLVLEPYWFRQESVSGAARPAVKPPGNVQQRASGYLRRQ